MLGEAEGEPTPAMVRTRTVTPRSPRNQARRTRPAALTAPHLHAEEAEPGDGEHACVPDRRQRLLHLTQAGTTLETRLTSVQGRRFAAAYQEAGVDAVAGFQRVLRGLLDNSTVNQLTRHDQSAID